MTEAQFSIDNINFYAVNVGDPDGIPAVELDITTNEYNILLFTSEEAAALYCSLKAPKQIDDIYMLDKRYHGDRVLHTSLVRMSRVCKLRYPQITGIIFDHPGHMNQKVRYASIEATVVAMSAVTKKSLSILDFVSEIEKEDQE